MRWLTGKILRYLLRDQTPEERQILMWWYTHDHP